MKAFGPYVRQLRRLLLDRRGEESFPLLAAQALNGEASSRLAELVSVYDQKRTGAFFSSSNFSEQVASRVPIDIARSPALITDPACGAGNLLLAAAKRLPLKRSLSATLTLWGKHLAGFDLYTEFVKATHLRLAILAMSRGVDFDLPVEFPLQRFFPYIRQGDGLRELSTLPTIGHILINPPFGPVTAPDDCAWAKGKITKAAIFFERCLQILPANTKVSGILPDVLRAGSRYQRWREGIEKQAEVIRITPMGNFETADVDVFLLDLKTGGQCLSKARNGRWWSESTPKENVGQRFEIHVGAVVPHRLKKNEGPIYPFLHAKRLPFWGVFNPGDEKVSFAGSSVRPPFVAVRRTSSPSDRFRALGTIITGSAPIAVENHLLVCIPKSGGLKSCRSLLKTLKRQATNEFLNERIRCRHLTVGVVKEIPW